MTQSRDVTRIEKIAFPVVIAILVTCSSRRSPR